MAGMKLVRAEQQLEPRPLTSAQAEVVAAASGSARAIWSAGRARARPRGGGRGGQVQVGVPLSRLVVLTGSRSAAQHLRARIVAALGRTQRGLQVTTVHGWCQQLLHRFEDPEHPMPRLLSAPEQELRVRELLVGRGPQSWPESLRPALGTRGFAREVRAILARARQLGLDPADVAAAGRAAERPEWVAVAEFFNEYLDVLDAEGVIDYAELVHRARLLLTDERRPQHCQPARDDIHRRVRGTRQGHDLLATPTVRAAKWLRSPTQVPVHSFRGAGPGRWSTSPAVQRCLIAAADHNLCSSARSNRAGLGGGAAARTGVTARCWRSQRVRQWRADRGR